MERNRRREGFGEKGRVAHLSMAADHNAAGRERPMLGANVGDLTHLEPDLSHVFTSRYIRFDIQIFSVGDKPPLPPPPSSHTPPVAHQGP